MRMRPSAAIEHDSPGRTGSPPGGGVQGTTQRRASPYCWPDWAFPPARACLKSAAGPAPGPCRLPLRRSVSTAVRVVAVDISGSRCCGSARQRRGRERAAQCYAVASATRRCFRSSQPPLISRSSRMGVMFRARIRSRPSQYRQRPEAGRPPGFRLLGSARRKPALANFLRHCAAPFGPPSPQPAHEACPLAFCRPRPCPRGACGGRLRRDHRLSGPATTIIGGGPEDERGRR